jgi:hypothetical protein
VYPRIRIHHLSILDVPAPILHGPNSDPSALTGPYWQLFFGRNGITLDFGAPAAAPSKIQCGVLDGDALRE